MKDLVALVADKDMEYTLKGLLTRPQALGIRKIDFDVFAHPEHDPGCALYGVGFLSQFHEQYDYALLMFDHEGSGRDSTPAVGLRDSTNREFARSPWGERAATVVLVPELEAWVWSDSPHVDEVTGWQGRQPELRRWMQEHRWLDTKSVKPARPKEAFQAALRATGTPRSSSLYRRLAEKVSLKRCTDPAFDTFKGILRGWFPQEGSA